MNRRVGARRPTPPRNGVSLFPPYCQGGHRTRGIVSNTLDAGTVAVSGTAVSTTVSSGGTQVVSAGGTATDTIVTTGGTEVVNGSASGTVLKGGQQDVESGGKAINATVSAGAQAVEFSGVTSGTILLGGYENVGYAGTAVNTVVNSNAILEVHLSGAASGTTISSGGEIIVDQAGSAFGTVLSGAETDDSYAVVSGTTIGSGDCSTSTAPRATPSSKAVATRSLRRLWPAPSTPRSARAEPRPSFSAPSPASRR
jgi:fibronectin-binding autotransporter adhesin